MGRDQLAETNHKFAIRKSEYLHGATEDCPGQRAKSGGQVARLEMQRAGIDGNDFLQRRTNPDCGAIGGEICATGAGNGNLGNAGLVKCGKDLDAIHGAVRDEQMFVHRIVSHMPVTRLAEGIIGR